MASRLPSNPSIDHLRGQARKLQRAKRIPLHDAQFAVARDYGFSSWPRLVHYLRDAATLSVDPGALDEDALGAADRFCSWASLRYNETDAPPRWEAAATLLATEPDLVDRHIWAAASASDPAALARHLTTRPASANSGGGPFGWVPLMYLAYSRVPLGHNGNDVLTAAALLLDAGADPNAGYLWCGLSTPFTVLTGVFGEGEQGPRRQPRHPIAAELASLLLTRGAHPVDQQTLYNRMFRADNSHLELLFGHGLADAGPSPWELRLGEAMESRDEMWRRQVGWAAEHGFTDRLELLARHGIDVSGVDVVAPVFPDDPNALDDEGATALHHAAWSGDIELIRRLLDAGADATITDRRFGTTPLEWAEHAYQSEAADMLRPHIMPAPSDHDG
ncbi:ankyrin repeat domain-containing protein [Mycolicibacterium neworleansense]|uniref:Ankyrin repeats (3 copies) n=1 Tax=Mycolicibacterium neworleansense TaxID=146018 RepID=A0A0H5S745_9MYCO|nr:ankyrin repeat domain-containing protein [Mycolicibacterium neworleansense]MCV7361687.1 ankyrin repeat domain-containing protein [Mycolicibacterium neworleansense]CRZ17044.1 Ankyrin repeats (3 copies) [Mycolicibacterium neworleansense]